MYIYWRPAQERSGLFLARYLDRVFSGPREGLSTNYSFSVTYLGYGLICFPFYYFMTVMISTFFFLVKTLQIVQIMANIVSWIILICSPGDTELHLIFIRVHFLFFLLEDNNDINSCLRRSSSYRSDCIPCIISVHWISWAIHGGWAFKGMETLDLSYVCKRWNSWGNSFLLMNCL